VKVKLSLVFLGAGGWRLDSSEFDGEPYWVAIYSKK